MNNTEKSTNNFVVLTTQRSGSTWLIGILNQLENTTACDELFLNRHRIVGKKYWDSDFAYPRFIDFQPEGWKKNRPFSVFTYLEELYQQPGSMGFKLMYSHLKAHPEILFYLMVKRISVIHLIRQNHLDVIVSRQVKHKTGRAHVLVGEQKPEKVLIELDTQTLIKTIQELQNKQDVIRKLLHRFHLRHIEVIYEDLVRDRDRFNPIWNFMAIDTLGYLPPPKLVKIRRGGHAEVIRNYNEVKAVLMDSAFANLID
jgi:LPS sulfotransferase NodH